MTERHLDLYERVKNKILIGTEIIIPSTLSNMPPCPGNNFPESLTFASLFK